MRPDSASLLHAVLASCVLGAFVLVPSAWAGPGCDGASVVEHDFDEADADDDGLLVREEYEAAGLEQFGVTFEQSDLDGDGVTTFDEYLDLYEAHHPPRHASEV